MKSGMRSIGSATSCFKCGPSARWASEISSRSFHSVCSCDNDADTAASRHRPRSSAVPITFSSSVVRPASSAVSANSTNT
ncbi:hypothetical protein G6F24_018259 [Rhizopus arrhizus]|nr:hypothetical protein G6F24_018259 [Rhizopus arrhizus]